jgi:hypothetical protein
VLSAHVIAVKERDGARRRPIASRTTPAFEIDGCEPLKR